MAPFLAQVKEVGQLAVSVMAITAVCFPVVSIHASYWRGGPSLNTIQQQQLTSHGQELGALGQQLNSFGQQQDKIAAALKDFGQQQDKMAAGLKDMAAAMEDVQVRVHKMAGDR